MVASLSKACSKEVRAQASINVLLGPESVAKALEKSLSAGK